MQTFLVYPDFAKSAQALDRARLGKQRVEVLQLLMGLAGMRKNGWKNHPASKMWIGHERSLIEYGKAVCNEWLFRGYKDTCMQKISQFQDYFKPCLPPPWLGNEDFHRSHQSNLIRKFPEHYQPQFPGVKSDLPYIWPVQ